MDAGTIFDPQQPDLVLLCKDGRTVPAHSCLLMLASEPLMPAIKMAIEEASYERPSKRPSPGSASSSVTGAPTTCKLEDDDADAWQLALKFLDPSRVQRPDDITWVSVCG